MLLHDLQQSRDTAGLDVVVLEIDLTVDWKLRRGGWRGGRRRGGDSEM